MKKSRGVIVMLLTVLVIGALGFTCINGVDSTGSGAAKNIKLGLDLAGGVSITYEAEGDPTKEQMKDTVYKLQKRVEGYSTEALVYQEGSDPVSYTHLKIPSAVWSPRRKSWARSCLNSRA